MEFPWYQRSKDSISMDPIDPLGIGPHTVATLKDALKSAGHSRKWLLARFGVYLVIGFLAGGRLNGLLLSIALILADGLVTIRKDVQVLGIGWGESERYYLRTMTFYLKQLNESRADAETQAVVE